MAEAARHDRKIVIEAAVPDAREIECAVLGNDDPQASIPGERDHPSLALVNSRHNSRTGPVDHHIVPAENALVDADWVEANLDNAFERRADIGVVRKEVDGVLGGATVVQSGVGQVNDRPAR